jgi:hypothetical protein
MIRFLLLAGIEWTDRHQAAVAICGASLITLLLAVMP